LTAARRLGVSPSGGRHTQPAALVAHQSEPLALSLANPPCSLPAFLGRLRRNYPPNLEKCCHRQSSRVVSCFAPHVHGLAGLGELTTDPLEGAIHSQRSLRSCELPGLAGPDYLSDVRPRTGPHRAVEARAGPFCCSLYRPIAEITRNTRVALLRLSPGSPRWTPERVLPDCVFSLSGCSLGRRLPWSTAFGGPRSR